MTDYMLATGGHGTVHYVERNHTAHGLRFGPGCRNAVAHLELGTGKAVTCKACEKLPGIRRRAARLQLATGGAPLRQCHACGQWKPLSNLRRQGAYSCCATYDGRTESCDPVWAAANPWEHSRPAPGLVGPDGT